MSHVQNRFGIGLLWAGLLCLIGLLGSVSSARAQDDLQDASFRVVAELNGGAAFYGHFLEQRVVSPTDGSGERELTAETGPAVGAVLGLRLFERNVVRLSLDYLPSRLQYRDDTGSGADDLDTEGVVDLQLFAVSIEAERTFFQLGRLAPYASVGLTGGWWHLDEGENIRASADRTMLFRWGSTSGLGMRVRLTPSLSLNLEANRLSLGNPFDGNEAFRARGAGTKIDEPSSVGVLRARGGLRYIF